MSRLRLDWTLSTSAERSAFLDKYISELKFTPTPDELEMMGNYVLWGRGANGKNAEENGDVSLNRTYKTWTTNEPVSLNELCEMPGFNERTIRPIGVRHEKTPHFRIDRAELLRAAPAHLHQTLRELFHNIDTLDVQIGFYELAHGKRKNALHDDLLHQFTPDDLAELREKGESLSYYGYLKKRHLVVELRREQYTIRDSFCPISMVPNFGGDNIEEDLPLTFDADVEVRPLGLDNKHGAQKLLFRKTLSPDNFSEAELTLISKELQRRAIYQKQNAEAVTSTHQRNVQSDVEGGPPSHDRFFDFRDAEQVATLVSFYDELRDAAATPYENSIYSTTQQLLDTFDWYVDYAQLSDIQRTILELKINKVKNENIVSALKEKYGRTYGINYISTIFRRKICAKIAAAAQSHLEVISELFYPENWKKCTNCGRTLLINESNFMHKYKSKDGFASQCKICDKEKRKRLKEL